MLRYADHRAHLDTIIRAALKAADPAEAVRRHWPEVDLGDAERVFIVGAGKAGAAMAAAAAELLGPRLARGVVAIPSSPPTSRLAPQTLHASRVTPPDSRPNPAVMRVTFIPAGHPEPDSGSLQAGEAIAGLLNGVTEHDLVLALFSGGGSALMELPAPGVTLEALQSLNDGLLRSGAPVADLNCVRKHLSRIKGGGLARLAAPARVVALILSDVIGDPLDVIASGPTAPDPTTVADAQAILNRRGQDDAAIASRLIETLKPGDLIFERVKNIVIGSNALALQAAAGAARWLGFEVETPELVVEGEAREWGERLVASRDFLAAKDAENAEKANKISAHSAFSAVSNDKTSAVILGGETTVTVRGSGVGGRNQELALAAALALDGMRERIVIASVGTDGIDGPTPAAGAWATPDTAARARALGLDAAAMLANNDSHSFFAALGDCLLTGPTGTNVNDLVIVLTYRD
ncbi:MAG: DUF4147 domain-containing protein [Chloroflexota bacterium]